MELSIVSSAFSHHEALPQHKRVATSSTHTNVREEPKRQKPGEAAHLSTSILSPCGSWVLRNCSA
jgi:hypothetical protein